MWIDQDSGFGGINVQIIGSSVAKLKNSDFWTVFVSVRRFEIISGGELSACVVHSY